MTKYLLVFTLIFTSLYASKNDTLNIYFDTPNLHLLKKGASLNYEAKSYLTKKKKVKYHESIIYNSKKQKERIFEVKHYKTVKSIEGKHPLLSLLKRNQRETFKALLKQEGITYPLKLKYILKSTDLKTYQLLFAQKTEKDWFFRYKIEYPYYINLLDTLPLVIVGLLIIYIMLRFKKSSLY